MPHNEQYKRFKFSVCLTANPNDVTRRDPRFRVHSDDPMDPMEYSALEVLYKQILFIPYPHMWRLVKLLCELEPDKFATPPTEIRLVVDELRPTTTYLLRKLIQKMGKFFSNLPAMAKIMTHHYT